MKQELETIYVQLDALLDTRLGTLAKIGPEFATKALGGDYFNRRIDEFPGVSHAEFAKAYAKRDVETLQMSLPTSVFLFLHTCIRNVIQDVVRAGNNPGFRVVVNYHPYDLQEQEVEVMQAVISERLLGVVDVVMVNISDEELTPSRVRNDFAMIVRYDFESWLMHHVSELERVQMPTVSLIAPALFQKIPTKSEEADLKAQERDPLRDTEVSLAPFIRLTFLDAAVFSIDQDIIKQRLDGIKETPAEAEIPSKPVEEVEIVEAKPAVSAPAVDDPDFPML